MFVSGLSDSILWDADDVGFLAQSVTGADWGCVLVPAGRIVLDNL